MSKAHEIAHNLRFETKHLPKAQEIGKYLREGRYSRPYIGDRGGEDGYAVILGLLTGGREGVGVDAVILGRGEESPWLELPAAPGREITAGANIRRYIVAGK